MTSKEAYDYLLGLLELEDDIRWPLVKESMDKFKELVDKATPKKVAKCFDDNSKGKCCRCNGIVNYFMNYRYCSYCGQALDWSDNND